MSEDSSVAIALPAMQEMAGDNQAMQMQLLKLTDRFDQRAVASRNSYSVAAIQEMGGRNPRQRMSRMRACIHCVAAEAPLPPLRVGACRARMNVLTFIALVYC
jgi:hypothetical protein